MRTSTRELVLGRARLESWGWSGVPVAVATAGVARGSARARAGVPAHGWSSSDGIWSAHSRSDFESSQRLARVGAPRTTEMTLRPP